MTSGAAAALPLAERQQADGRTRLALVDGDVDACALTIDDLRMHDGAGGLLRIGGLGNVVTRDSHRRRGLASRLCGVAIERMRTAGFDASLLYGIDGFYEPLGWRSCGDERWVRIDLAGEVQARPAPELVGRAATTHDLAHMVAMYAILAPGIAGALVRDGDGRIWRRFDPADAWVVERAGRLVGWAWRGRGRLPERDATAEREPEAAVFAELHAVDAAAMGAVVEVARAAARACRVEPGRTELLVGAPEAHPLRMLARDGALACRLVDEVRPRGGAMLLPFTSRALGLGELHQFLPDRF